MTDDELDKVGEKIRRKLRLTRMDIEHLEEKTRPIAPEKSLGRLTRMDALQNKGVNEAALHQARQTLNQLEHALQRIERRDPAFGKCGRCGAVIPLPRLMLMPESDKCVNCAQ